MKLEVLDLESNYFQGVIYHVKSEVLDLESNLLFPAGGGGGNLLHKIRSASS